MASVGPASNEEQAIARVGLQQALLEAAAAACRDCRATASKHAVPCWYEPLRHKELGTPCYYN